MSSKYKHDKEKFHPVRERLYEIIFEADTNAGKVFDIALLVFIIASVIVVMLETVNGIGQKYHDLFLALEWIFTIFFTFEYILRIYTVHRPHRYIFSFYGVVDLLSILPTFISIFLPGTQSLLVIRALRLLRIFRIFKLGHFLFESQVLMKALVSSKNKIIVFLTFILILVVIFGSIMYLVEGFLPGGNENFDSIPRSVYWAIVTLTTVGYGDIAPNTWLGQFIAALVMILGYSVIAVPTGIVTSEITEAFKKRHTRKRITTQICSYCLKEGHEDDAMYCKFCGGELSHSHLQDTSKLS
ncbi:MAG: ion transporter [Bacteroidia bacterium]|nr:ion transporter [Bacteroidia bacterium]MBT8229203.1 ion transporter [Bacteroidia bacterium]